MKRTIGRCFITTVLIFSFIQTSYATTLKSSSTDYDVWSSEIRGHVENYYNPHKDQFLSTIMGVCAMEWPWKKKYGVYRDRDFQDRDLADRIPVTQVFSYKQKLKVDPKFHADNSLIGDKEMKKVQVAPLVIFLPGMFNELDDSQNRRFMLSLSKRGHHVATLPNPLSTDYITAKPNYKPGEFLREARTLYRAIKRIVLSYKMRGILKDDQVQILGVSYGSLLSAIITVLDANDANVLTAGTTLISPPLNFRKALKRLDTYIDETSDSFAGMFWTGKLYKFLRVCFSSGFERRDEWAKGMTIYSGFQEYLVNSIKVWRRVNNIEEDMPYQNPDWEKTFKFDHYLDWYAPEVKEMLEQPESELQHWVNQARNLGKPVRILAAVDDWLNSPEEWEDFYQDQVIILPNGGHYGFRKLQWFEKFLTLAFPTL